jgi:hypothetical protein
MAQMSFARFYFLYSTLLYLSLYYQYIISKGILKVNKMVCNGCNKDKEDVFHDGFSNTCLDCQDSYKYTYACRSCKKKINIGNKYSRCACGAAQKPYLSDRDPPPQSSETEKVKIGPWSIYIT